MPLLKELHFPHTARSPGEAADDGDNVHAKVYLTDQKTRRRTTESMMMARAIVSGPALYNHLHNRESWGGAVTPEEKALLDYIETGRKP